MKSIQLLLLFLCICTVSAAQTKVEKSVSVNPGDQVKFEFKWPELIKFKSWEKNEIKIVASVDINKGQNDDAFKIYADDSSKEILISTGIEDYENLPRKIVIMKDGQEYFFNTDDQNSAEIQQFKKEHGDDNYSYVSHGVIMDITLEIWVPNSIALDVYSKFGLVEVVDLASELKVHSKFGGIDLATTGKFPIKAGTKFGEKYTNLSSEITTIQNGNSPGKWDWVQLGQSNDIIHELKSDFGNIYIRKH